MTLRTALRLGRVSNLPTVWTNVMAGLALGGATPTPALVVPLAVAASLFYVAGMYLNDAFDHRWDAQHRPERPIPAGEVRAGTVFAAGPGHPTPLVAGAALAALIVLYDVSHKRNPLAPVVMGLCRVGVYAIGALAVTPHPPVALWIGSAALLLYLIALTAIARHETRNPRLPALVGQMIAGICLLDAAVLLVMGHPVAALVAAAGFPLTRLFQRRIAGT
jgi:4-hydroxybenzoate polyprenyltransferase